MGNESLANWRGFDELNSTIFTVASLHFENKKVDIAVATERKAHQPSESFQQGTSSASILHLQHSPF